MRHLRLVKPIKEKEMTVKIAFASNDRRLVNQHFGAAEAFAIFAMTETDFHLVEVAEFIETAMDGHEGKLAAKIELLEGCAAVYCNAAGASAIQQLLSKGIQPMRVDEGSAIDGLLSGLQKSMQTDPPVWLSKNIKKLASIDRFSTDEEWQE
jgi:nitrogen fixation protein NifX